MTETVSFKTPEKVAALKAALLDLAFKLHAQGIQIAPNKGDTGRIHGKPTFVGFVEVMPGFRAALLRFDQITISRNGGGEVTTIVPENIRDVHVWVNPD